MEKLKIAVSALSRGLDKIAGLCMVLIMVVVVSNILMRVIFNRPILGTVDYVVFLTVAVIALSLAHCALQKGHIAVSFVVDRLPLKIQAVVDLSMNAAAMFFWGLCAWQIFLYANKMAASGLVSATAQIPVYPFIYLVAIGLLALSLVLLVSTVESTLRVFSPSSSYVREGKAVEFLQKAAAVNK